MTFRDSQFTLCRVITYLGDPIKWVKNALRIDKSKKHTWTKTQKMNFIPFSFITTNISMTKNMAIKLSKEHQRCTLFKSELKSNKKLITSWKSLSFKMRQTYSRFKVIQSVISLGIQDIKMTFLGDLIFV